MTGKFLAKGRGDVDIEMEVMAAYCCHGCGQAFGPWHLSIIEPEEGVCTALCQSCKNTELRRMREQGFAEGDFEAEMLAITTHTLADLIRRKLGDKCWDRKRHKAA